MMQIDGAAEPGAVEEERFVAAMKRLREGRGWSQGELARRLSAAGWEGVYQTTVSRIEKRERPVRLGEAKAIAEVFGTGIANMMAPPEEGRLIDGMYLLIREMDQLRVGLQEKSAALVKAREDLQRMVSDVERDLDGWADESVRKTMRGLLPFAEEAINKARGAVVFQPGQGDGHGEHSEEA